MSASMGDGIPFTRKHIDKREPAKKCSFRRRSLAAEKRHVSRMSRTPQKGISVGSHNKERNLLFNDSNHVHSNDSFCRGPDEPNSNMGTFHPERKCRHTSVIPSLGFDYRGFMGGVITNCVNSEIPADKMVTDGRSKSLAGRLRSSFGISFGRWGQPRTVGNSTGGELRPELSPRSGKVSHSFSSNCKEEVKEGNSRKSVLASHRDRFESMENSVEFSALDTIFKRGLIFREYAKRRNTKLPRENSSNDIFSDCHLSECPDQKSIYDSVVPAPTTEVPVISDESISSFCSVGNGEGEEDVVVTTERTDSIYIKEFTHISPIHKYDELLHDPLGTAISHQQSSSNNSHGIDIEMDERTDERRFTLHGTGYHEKHPVIYKEWSEISRHGESLENSGHDRNLEISGNNEWAENSGNDVSKELPGDEEPSEISRNNEWAQNSGNDVNKEIAADEEPSEISGNQEPSEIFGDVVNKEVTGDEEPSEISGNQEPLGLPECDGRANSYGSSTDLTNPSGVYSTRPFKLDQKDAFSMRRTVTPMSLTPWDRRVQKGQSSNETPYDTDLSDITKLSAFSLCSIKLSIDTAEPLIEDATPHCDGVGSLPFLDNGAISVLHTDFPKMVMVDAMRTSVDDVEHYTEGENIPVTSDYLHSVGRLHIHSDNFIAGPSITETETISGEPLLHEEKREAQIQPVSMSTPKNRAHTHNSTDMSIEQNVTSLTGATRMGHIDGSGGNQEFTENLEDKSRICSTGMYSTLHAGPTDSLSNDNSSNNNRNLCEVSYEMESELRGESTTFLVPNIEIEQSKRQEDIVTEEAIYPVPSVTVCDPIYTNYVERKVEITVKSSDKNWQEGDVLPLEPKTEKRRSVRIKRKHQFVHQEIESVKFKAGEQVMVTSNVVRDASGPDPTTIRKKRKPIITSKFHAKEGDENTFESKTIGDQMTEGASSVYSMANDNEPGTTMYSSHKKIENDDYSTSGVRIWGREVDDVLSVGTPSRKADAYQGPPMSDTTSIEQDGKIGTKTRRSTRITKKNTAIEEMPDIEKTGEVREPENIKPKIKKEAATRTPRKTKAKNDTVKTSNVENVPSDYKLVRSDQESNKILTAGHETSSNKNPKKQGRKKKEATLGIADVHLTPRVYQENDIDTPSDVLDDDKGVAETLYHSNKLDLSETRTSKTPRSTKAGVTRTPRAKKVIGDKESETTKKKTVRKSTRRLQDMEVPDAVEGLERVVKSKKAK